MKLERTKAGPFTFPGANPYSGGAGSHASTAAQPRADPRTREATLDEADKNKFRIKGWKNCPTVKALEQLDTIIRDSKIEHLSIELVLGVASAAAVITMVLSASWLLEGSLATSTTAPE